MKIKRAEFDQLRNQIDQLTMAVRALAPKQPPPLTKWMVIAKKAEGYPQSFTTLWLDQGSEASNKGMAEMHIEDKVGSGYSLLDFFPYA